MDGKIYRFRFQNGSHFYVGQTTGCVKDAVRKHAEYIKSGEANFKLMEAFNSGFQLPLGYKIIESGITSQKELDRLEKYFIQHHGFYNL
jgi:hypothetical protein